MSYVKITTFLLYKNWLAVIQLSQGIKSDQIRQIKANLKKLPIADMHCQPWAGMSELT